MLDPENPSLQAMAAYVDAQSGWSVATRDEADVPQLATLTRLIERAPECALAHGYRGMLRARLGFIESAAVDLREAIRINPYHAPMRHQLDAVQRRLRPDDAVETSNRKSWFRRLLGD